MSRVTMSLLLLALLVGVLAQASAQRTSVQGTSAQGNSGYDGPRPRLPRVTYPSGGGGDNNNGPTDNNNGPVDNNNGPIDNNPNPGDNSGRVRPVIVARPVKQFFVNQFWKCWTSAAPGCATGLFPCASCVCAWVDNRAPPLNWPHACEVYARSGVVTPILVNGKRKAA